MLRIYFIFFGLIIGAVVVDAQPPHVRAKPRAKTQFRDSGAIKQVVTYANPVQLKGPSAKNQLRGLQVRSGKAIPVTRSARMWMKGPGAKNYQPNIQKSNPNIFRHSSRKE